MRRRRGGCLSNLLLLGFLALVALVVYFSFFADNTGQRPARTVEQPQPARRVDPPASSPPRAPPPSTRPTEAGTRVVAELLAELDDFRSDARLHEIGFGRAGPYYAWLERAEAAQHNEQFSLFERTAAGDLITMAFEYMRSEGSENSVTRALRPEVQKVIDP